MNRVRKETGYQEKIDHANCVVNVT